MQAIDLFAGIGGFKIACDWLKIDTAQFVEINPYCQKQLKKHYPSIPIHDDVRTCHPPSSIDLVIGGSPCQGNSQAGKKTGLADPRSSLWFEQLRIIQESNCTFAIWENPRGAHSQGALQTVLRGLYESGYRFDVEIISAKELGAPQERQRIFVTAYSNRFIKATRGEILASWASQIGSQIEGARTFGVWASPFSGVYGVAHGFPERMAGISALGNAVVPQCALVPLMRVLYLNSLLN